VLRRCERVFGKAPLPIVITLVATAVLTVLLFLFPGMPLVLAGQMVAVGK
jgi:hypothetical protein